VGGVGAGVYDRLVEMGYGDIVRAVNFGSSPMEPAPLDPHGKPNGGPLNRRAETWMKSKEWLEDIGGVQIPDSDSLQADACGPGYKYDSHTRLQLEGKDQNVGLTGFLKILPGPSCAGARMRRLRD
jgi:hypothetical protein